MIVAPATRALLETYLRIADGPRHIRRICEYMKTMHRVPSGTTRTMLYRLSAIGVVIHLDNHCYQGGTMTQKTQTEVIDSFSDAVARVAQHAPPDVVAALHTATGDLIESLNSGATNMVAQSLVVVLHRLEANQARQDEDRSKVDAMQVDQDAMQVAHAADHILIEALDARTERRGKSRNTDEQATRETL